MSPEFDAHSDNILLKQERFQRVETLYYSRDGLNLDPASAKLLEDTYRSFIRAGARLTDAEQQRMREINERVSDLTTRFQEQLLEMTRERAVIVEDVELLDGLNPDQIGRAHV